MRLLAIIALLCTSALPARAALLTSYFYNVDVATNLTTHGSITLGGVTRSSWLTGQAMDVAGVVDPSVFYDTNIVIGNMPATTNAVWTVPAGYYATLLRTQFTTTNAATLNLGFTTNGATRILLGNFAVTTNTVGANQAGFTYTYEEGESLIAATSAPGVNGSWLIRYWPKTVDWIRPFKHIVSDTNTNVIFTASSNKMAYDARTLYAAPLTVATALQVTHSVTVGAGTVLLKLFAVAPGEAPSSTNILYQIPIASGTTTTLISPPPPGYSLYFASNTATNTICVFGTAIEAPYPNPH